MRDVGFFDKILLAVEPVDFRKQAHGLALIVEHTFQKSGTNSKLLFVFTNRRKTAVKMLYWDHTGYALWWKTLEKSRFTWPSSADDCLSLKTKELKWLLEGVDLSKVKTHERVVLD